MVLKQRLSAAAAHNSMLGFLIRKPKDQGKDDGADADRPAKRQRVSDPAETRFRPLDVVAQPDKVEAHLGVSKVASGAQYSPTRRRRQQHRKGEAGLSGSADSKESVVEGYGDADCDEGQEARGIREEEDADRRTRTTDLESAMPAFMGDEEVALEEYEAFRASQEDTKRALEGDGLGSTTEKASSELSNNGTEEGKTRLQGKKWIKGRSSIYVDAFKLALETVLDEEAHLFDERERTIFTAWDELSYEAQYL